MEIDELTAGLEEHGGYQALVPEDAMYGPEGSQEALRSAKAFESLPKDIPGLVKRQLEMERELGGRVRWPNEGNEEEAVKFRTELRERGYMPNLPQDASGYTEALSSVEGLPEGMEISPELAGRFGEIALKHGVPAEALAEMAGVQAELMGQTMESIKAQLPGLSITEAQREETLSALKAEFPDDFNDRLEGAARLRDQFVPKETQELMSYLGLGDDPRLLGVFMKMGKAAQGDSSYLKDLGLESAAMSREDVREEVGRAMSDPKHEMFEEFKKNTKKWQQWQEALYKPLEPAEESRRLVNIS